MRRITLALSSHRMETLPLAFELMRGHQAICLEEPRAPGFRSMLAGEMSIEEYLLGVDPEFPAFSRQQCHVLRELSAQGKRLLQVDPFLEILHGIHDFFADGGTPERIEKDSVQREVYEAENRWTSALLHYYEKASGSAFDETVAAVKRFARADAARGLIRDKLRAAALLDLIRPFDSVYVEAGYLHLALWVEMRRRLDVGWTPRLAHLTAPVVRGLTGRPMLLGPGDRLTLLFTFRPDHDSPGTDLLAARSLIHVKLLEKEELQSAEVPYPHACDEIESNRLVRDLSYQDCRALYPMVRRRTPPEAREVARELLRKVRPGSPWCDDSEGSQ